MSDTYMNIVLDEKLKRKVEDIAEKEQRSVSAQVRVIIEKWLESTNET